MRLPSADEIWRARWERALDRRDANGNIAVHGDRVFREMMSDLLTLASHRPTFMRIDDEGRCCWPPNEAADDEQATQEAIAELTARAGVHLGIGKPPAMRERDDTPAGLCACGCGQPAAPEGRYAVGHSRRGRGRPIAAGDRFGRLTALEDRQPASRTLRCVCDCGTACEPYLTNLFARRTLSCGCLQAETRVANGRAQAAERQVF
jgi:hypothetical protein